MLFYIDMYTRPSAIVSLSMQTALIILLLLNALRGEANALMPSPLLNERAQTRAEYLCSHNQWSHRSWLRSFEGIEYRMVGENLSRNQDPFSAFVAWFNSPTHLINMLNPIFRSVGVGTECGIIVTLFADI